ncbi:MAG: efflux RND transporter periplasmic adaptor subunit [Alphaproteobacteria bacterium]|nr:efflux RND transporter periplasmic adaptor subunit [Alphaproteobacteria bacterium]
MGKSHLAPVAGVAAILTIAGFLTVIGPSLFVRAGPDPVAWQAAGARAATQPGTVERRILYYRNPMGLPDTSPIPKRDGMGMDYIPVYADAASDRPGTVRISLDKVQRSGVRTEVAALREIVRPVRAVGTITADEAKLVAVTAKFGGFVEELYGDVIGVRVKAGQRLMRVWIEGAEILQKQADHLTSLRSGDAAQIDQTERNLRQFDFPGSAIEELARTRRPIRSIVLAAPIGGTVIEKAVLVGSRFDPGHMHFKIADLSSVWVVADIAERDLASVRVGDPARVRLLAFPVAPVEGRVGLIYPELNPAARTARVRIDIPNPDGHLKIGLYGEVEIETRGKGGPMIAVPEAAIIDSGRRRVVFVAKDRGVFEPRDIVTGRRGSGLVEIRSGAAEGEKVVVAGNFLIDAESNLRAALAVFIAPKE